MCRGELMNDFQPSALGWTKMVEQPWPTLVKAGLPIQLASLARELGHYTERPLRAFTMPVLNAGVAGLAVPFLGDDGILFDPSLISNRFMLGEVVAHELASMLHPHWDDPGPDDDEEIESFASKLGPMLLAAPPDYPMADVAAMAPRRRSIR
jgi:hypothetical protein